MLPLARKILAISILGWGSLAWSAEPTLESGSVIAAAERLEPGEFLWVPELAPEGPVLLVVSLTTQRAVIYRNGLPIGITTVSTGRPGHQTPTGMFTILQRRVEHYSNLYNNAPMPYMQRLTWGGVALHGGELPGYPASHGCIRLPHEFARLLYGVSHLGMTVVVTEDSVVPRVAPVEALLGGRRIASTLEASSIWQPEAAATGPVSIVVSAADGRVIVLRNGTVIGSAPVTIDGTIDRTTAYMLRAGVGAQRSWIRISVPGQETDPGSELRGRIHVEDGFRQNVEAILAPGTTVVVTQDSLRADGPAQATVLESDERP